MGKIRTRVLGIDDVEEKQKKEQKLRSEEKKLEKKKAEREVKKETEKTVAVAEAKPEKKPPKAKKTEGRAATSKTRSKKYLASKKFVDQTKSYSLKEAVSILKKIKYSKFDESVELHINVDVTGLKGELELPHSTGKTVRVVIVSDAVLADIEKGKFDFDVLVSHPSFMPKLARHAKVLGPKGLMPNPKAGTISPHPEEVAKKYEKGLTRWKTEPKFPLVHQMIGKLSLEEKALVENATAILNSVGALHIQKAVVKSTMSPGVKVDVEKL